MKKKLLSALIAMSILATASISAFAATVSPQHKDLKGTNTINQEMDLDGSIYAPDGNHGNPELGYISVKAPVKLLFAVHNKNAHNGGTAETEFLTPADGYYLQNLGVNDINVDITGMSVVVDPNDPNKAKIDLDPSFTETALSNPDNDTNILTEKLDSINANQVALAIRLKDSNIGNVGDIIDLSTGQQQGVQTLGKLVGSADGSAGAQAKFELVAKYSKNFPTESLGTDFKVKFKYALAPTTVVPTP